jgi:hypothetical protein
MSVPNRAGPERQIGNHTDSLHYIVRHHTPTGEIAQGADGNRFSVTEPKHAYFSDKKSAYKYAKTAADSGWSSVSVEKHDKKSQDAGYTGGKPARLMETKIAARTFLKGGLNI